jgi:Arc/MetJ-type ribon-helix-helix transcriptional regulator
MGVLMGILSQIQSHVRNILSKIGVNIKFSKHLLNRIDQEVTTAGYSSRSELIIEAVVCHLDKSARADEIKKYLLSPEGRELIKEIQKENSE